MSSSSGGASDRAGVACGTASASRRRVGTSHSPAWPCEHGDPDGFIHRDEVIAYLEGYAASFAAPVREGVEVTALRPGRGEDFLLDTTAGPIAAPTVVVATGAYQRQSRPPGAATLPADVLQIDVGDYRSPADLPGGSVLVVGSGQSGCQIAEELREAGREVFLACERTPWLPRRIGDYDAVWSGVETGFFDAPVGSLPGPAARMLANVQQSGTDGGHDMHYRTLRAGGVNLLGRFVDADATSIRCAPDLADSVAWADRLHAQILGLIRQTARARGMAPPPEAEPEPLADGAPERISLDGMGAVIFATGYRPDYEAWIQLLGAFDELGFPLQRDGASTVVEDLYFIGVHFLRKRKSALFSGACEDAPIVARQVAARHGRSRA
jgi:putative flavoprotein involved in K+ transport